MTGQQPRFCRRPFLQNLSVVAALGGLPWSEARGAPVTRQRSPQVTVIENFEDGGVGGWGGDTGALEVTSDAPQGEYAGELAFDDHSVVWLDFDSTSASEFTFWWRSGAVDDNELVFSLHEFTDDGRAPYDTAGFGIEVGPENQTAVGVTPPFRNTRDFTALTDRPREDTWYRTRFYNVDFETGTFDVLLTDTSGTELGRVTGHQLANDVSAVNRFQIKNAMNYSEAAGYVDRVAYGGDTGDTGDGSGDGGTGGNGEGTVVARGLGEDDVFGISDADDDGSLHVAYSKGQQLHYARVATDGRVETSRRIATAEYAVGTVEVLAEPDGRAHVLYSTILNPDRPRPQAIGRTSLTPEGDIDVDQTLREGGGEHDLFLFDTLLVNDEVLAAVKNSPEGPPAEAELWRIDPRSSDWTDRRMDGIPSRYGVTDGMGLATHGDRLHVAYAYGRKLRGPGNLGLSVFQLENDTFVGTTQTEFDSQGQAENWRLPALTIDNQGRPVVAHAGGPKGSLDWSRVVVIGRDGKEVVETVYEADPPEGDWHAELLVTDRLVVGLPGEYRIYSPQFEPVAKRQVALGPVALGLNGGGGASLLGRTPDGELRYRTLNGGDRPGGGGGGLEGSQRKIALAGRVDEASVLSSVADRVGIDAADRTMAQEAVDRLSAAVEDGEIPRRAGNEAIARLIAAERATRATLEFLDADTTGAGFDDSLTFATRVARYAIQVVVEVLMQLIAVGDAVSKRVAGSNILSNVPDWVANAAGDPNVVSALTDDVIAKLLGKIIAHKGARDRTRAVCKRRSEDIYRRLAEGTIESAQDLSAAITAVAEAVTNAVAGFVQAAFETGALDLVSNPDIIDAVEDLRNGPSSVWGSLHGAHQAFAPDELPAGGEWTGDTAAGRQAVDRGIGRLRSTMTASGEWLDLIANTLLDFGIVENVFEAVDALTDIRDAGEDGWFDLDAGDLMDVVRALVNAVQAIVPIVKAKASLFVAAGVSAASARVTTWAGNTNQHMVQSAIHGEDRVRPMPFTMPTPDETVDWLVEFREVVEENT